MIGSNIKRLRQQRRITQKMLAEKLGVSRQALCLWEADKRELKATILKKIAKILSVPVDQLINTTKNSLKCRGDDMLRRKKQKKANFEVKAPEAQKVILTGDFNSWDPKGIPLKKKRNGVWALSKNFEPGRYEYKYIIDDQWQLDPNNDNTTTNSLGTQNSVLDLC